MRIRTSEASDGIINKVIGASEDAFAHHWQVMRLALALSFRRKSVPTALPKLPLQGTGVELRILAGAGKKSAEERDVADALRALLSVRHGCDLFAAGTDARFGELLEFHVHRGLEEISARLEREDLWSIIGSAVPRRPEAAKAPVAAGAADLTAALREIGVSGAPNGPPRAGPRWTRHPMRLSGPADFGRLKAGMDKLAFVLGVPPGHVAWAPGEGPNSVWLDRIRPAAEWSRYELADLRTWCARAPSWMSLPCCPGVDVAGQPFWIELADAPHLLIGGATGSGKSASMHALLVSLLLSQPAGRVELGLIDPKRVEMQDYKGLAELRWPNKVVTDLSEVESALASLRTEMERRYGDLTNQGCRNVLEAQRRGLKIPWIVLAIDELAQVVTSPAATEHLDHLARLGRAAGIHLLLATQRPDAATFSGQLRSNAPGRLALAVQTAVESRILLDDSGAEHLPRPGEMLIRLPDAAVRGLQRVHGVHLTGDDVREIVSERRKV